jgi:hypothetical protein
MNLTTQKTAFFSITAIGLSFYYGSIIEYLYLVSNFYDPIKVTAEPYILTGITIIAVIFFALGTSGFVYLWKLIFISTTAISIIFSILVLLEMTSVISIVPMLVIGLILWRMLPPTEPVEEFSDAVGQESGEVVDGDIVSTVLRYRPHIREYIDSLDITVVQERARETVEQTPKIELDQLKKLVSEFVDTELKPFKSEKLNAKYVELLAVSVESSEKFEEMVNLLGEDIDADALATDILPEALQNGN